MQTTPPTGETKKSISEMQVNKDHQNWCRIGHAITITIRALRPLAKERMKLLQKELFQDEDRVPDDPPKLWLGEAIGSGFQVGPAEVVLCKKEEDGTINESHPKRLEAFCDVEITEVDETTGRVISVNFGDQQRFEKWNVRESTYVMLRQETETSNVYVPFQMKKFKEEWKKRLKKKIRNKYANGKWKDIRPDAEKIAQPDVPNGPIDKCWGQSDSDLWSNAEQGPWQLARLFIQIASQPAIAKQRCLSVEETDVTSLSSLIQNCEIFGRTKADQGFPSTDEDIQKFSLCMAALRKARNDDFGHVPDQKVGNFERVKKVVADCIELISLLFVQYWNKENHDEHLALLRQCEDPHHCLDSETVQQVHKDHEDLKQRYDEMKKEYD